MIPINDRVHREIKEGLARQDIEDGRKLAAVLRWCPWCGRRNPRGELYCTAACEQRWLEQQAP
jgi:hypothetical protein